MIRGLTMAGVAGVGALVVAASIQAERAYPGASLAALGLMVAATVVIAACMGKPWALKIFFFVLIVIIDMSFRTRAADDLSVDSSVMFRLGLWSAALVIGVANISASLRFFRSASHLGLLTYVIFAAASSLYSLTPKYTLGCAYGQLCMLFFTAAVVARIGLKSALYVALAAMGTHVVVADLFWLVSPKTVLWHNFSGKEIRLRGFLGHPFRMAQGAALFLLLAWIMWRQRWLPTLMFAASAAAGGLALALTQTRSSIAAVGVALFSVGRLRPVNMLILTILFFGGLAVVQMAPGAWDVIGQQISRGGNVDSAMSGRTHIWSESLRLFAERPLMGYGYATTRVLFLEQFDVESIKGEAPPNAHNMLVQSLVTTGLVGTIFLLIAVIVPLVHSLRHREGLANPLIWYLTIVGLAGLGPIGATPGSVTIFWLLSLFMVHFATTGDSGSEGRIAAHHAGRYVQVRAGLGAKS